MSRRTVLRGVGAAVALPLLDAMVPALAATRNTAAAPVRRFGAVHIGMGMNMNVWSQREGDLQMNPIVASVAPFRDRCLVVGGLDSREAISNDQGQHPRAQSAWLTGCRAKKTDGPDIRLGTSLDQIVAREFEKATQLSSLELTAEPTDLSGSCAFGFSCAYNNTIAWRTPTTPLPMENNPRNVFERLFGASETSDPTIRSEQLKNDASILDSVMSQVTSLQNGLGAGDNRKMAEYLDAVRDAERRIQRAETQSSKEFPVVEQPAGIPDSFEEHVKLLLDLQLLAFQTDLTRVFTFVLARESSVRSYPQIGVPDGHHPLSHHQNNPEKLGRLSKINAHHLKLVADFVEKLAAAPDAGGTMLDHTMLLYGSGMSDSNLHIPTDVPTLLIAGKELGIKGNRALRYPERTPLANLQLTILDKLGLPVERFGDSTGELNNLTGV
jgi:hypothetical protein